MIEKLQKEEGQEKEIVIDTSELIEILVELLKNKEYPKKLPYPKFNIQETCFIRDLIFRKQRGLLFFYLADHLMNNTSPHQLPMFNAPSKRKLQFFYNYIGSGGNGKESAIKAGYSPKTAKQQASRIVREIRGYKRLT